MIVFLPRYFFTMANWVDSNTPLNWYQINMYKQHIQHDGMKTKNNNNNKKKITDKPQTRIFQLKNTS